MRIDTNPIVMTKLRIQITFVHIRPAMGTFKTVGTNTGERIDAIFTCCSVLARHRIAIIQILFTQTPVKSSGAGAVEPANEFLARGVVLARLGLTLGYIVFAHAASHARLAVAAIVVDEIHTDRVVNTRVGLAVVDVYLAMVS